jgi:hypothetical protein
LSKPAIPSALQAPAGIWFGDTTMADLERVLQQLQESEINAGVQTIVAAVVSIVLATWFGFWPPS